MNTFRIIVTLLITLLVNIAMCEDTEPKRPILDDLKPIKRTVVHPDFDIKGGEIVEKQ